ncbi:hypothetical protein GCM10011505_26310 [Tistrella bauzanensis]|uniref:Uncharacterized protein n=1 Tax=Tistrella bauzanensis TaxID=657419 RepID=A0ABQ1IIU0_9PROT|nr:hypothetical protein [Tistrella bauzanensis]GGB43730.1 hypothetical protein GCM10011505_26310 [Tistrella bauzanensis]
MGKRRTTPETPDRPRRRPRPRPWLAIAAVVVPLAAALVLALVRGAVMMDAPSSDPPPIAGPGAS